MPFSAFLEKRRVSLCRQAGGTPQAALGPLGPPQRASAMGWICSLTSKTLYVEGGWGQGEKRLLFFCLFPSIFKYMLSSMESGVHDQRGEPLLRVLQSPPSAVLSLGTGAGPADPHFSQAGSEGRGLSVEDLEWPGRGDTAAQRDQGAMHTAPFPAAQVSDTRISWSFSRSVLPGQGWSGRRELESISASRGQGGRGQEEHRSGASSWESSEAQSQAPVAAGEGD